MFSALQSTSGPVTDDVNSVQIDCCVEFFSNPSAIYTKWCAQTFPPIFGLFAFTDRNFAKIVAPPSDEYENYVLHLKEQSL